MRTKQISKLSSILSIALLLLLVVSSTAAAASGAGISVVGVKGGESAAIKAENFPANLEFQVLMNEIGTKGVDGIVVGTATTSKQGEFTKTFAIPESLKSHSRIAVRIEATNGSGWYAYNWFDNASRGSVGTPANQRPPSSGTTTGGAQIWVGEVVEDTTVSFEAENLPAKARFAVWLEWKNGRGQIKGYKVANVITNSRGSVDEIVNIPEALRDRKMLSLRLVDTSSSKISVGAWFLNASSRDGIGGASSTADEDGIPYLEVLAVEEGESVTISASSLPAKTEFTVLMGMAGTEGVKGIKVGTISSDKKGEFSETFDIPRDLRNRDDIAIRIQAVDDAGTYAFTWFDNETTP